MHVPTYTHPHTQIQMYSTVPSENGGASVGEVKRLSGSSTSTGLSLRSRGAKIQLSTLTGDWMDSLIQFVGRRGLANHNTHTHTLFTSAEPCGMKKGKTFQLNVMLFKSTLIVPSLFPAQNQKFSTSRDRAASRSSRVSVVTLSFLPCLNCFF